MEKQAETDITPTTVTNSRIITTPPTLYHDQLFGGGISYKGDERIVGFNDAIMIGFGGPRGSGKTTSLSYIGIKARALGLPVWSNVPIKFHYVDHKDKYMTLESRPLYFKDIFALSTELRGGWILIDEFQYFLPALGFQRTGNKLINAFNDQIRKNELSIGYSSKTMRRLDLTGREETDIWVDCKDAFFSEDGYGTHEKGDVIYWHIMDLSGIWTGKMFEMHPQIHRMRLEAKLFKGAFNTFERIDFMEAMRGVKLDLEATVLTDKEQGEPFSREVIEQQLTDIFSKTERIRPSELYEYLNVKGNLARNVIKDILYDMGIEQSVYNGQRYYNKKELVVV